VSLFRQFGGKLFQFAATVTVMATAWSNVLMDANWHQTITADQLESIYLATGILG